MLRSCFVWFSYGDNRVRVQLPPIYQGRTLQMRVSWLIIFREILFLSFVKKLACDIRNSHDFDF